MVVGLCEVILHLRGASNLKDKRRVIRKLVDRTRSKFGVSIAETGSNDSYRDGRIGFAVVSNNARHVESVLDKIVFAMREMYVAEIVSAQKEIIHWSEAADEGTWSP